MTGFTACPTLPQLMRALGAGGLVEKSTSKRPTAKLAGGESFPGGRAWWEVIISVLFNASFCAGGPKGSLPGCPQNGQIFLIPYKALMKYLVPPTDSNPILLHFNLKNDYIS